MTKSIELMEAENEALRICATKYLQWLNLIKPDKTLKEDMHDPDMVGAELAATLDRLSQKGNST
ncbi:hypothetical protein [Chromobacterium rhizoryzae]|uniref:Uncharacterized protein n=1 Tax=Chromobacterium rhizoryzae TaxID=1778675 RepID=A0AAD0W8I9_9NEIS|nr:hypothetical protein [Chromobacterium rhizoryzae]AXT46391.1 hypothetical protein D1345_09415 [Chromobacterium rhizoryzae]